MDTENSRKNKYRVPDQDQDVQRDSSRRGSKSIPKGNSGVMDNIMHFAHGEEESNVDPDKEINNYRSYPQSSNNYEINDVNEEEPEDGGNIKFK